MNRLLHFFQYHNAVPIAVSIVLLGAGGAFAAANPEAIYSTEEQVLSIDNTYLVGKDVETWTPTVQITGVTEDEDHYYVAYDFSTIDLVDYVWRDTVKQEVMKVSKADLGQYRDLGLYVTEQLKQVIAREHDRVAETQDIERKMVSQKTVATIYGGLVGKLLDESTEVLPGYVPVVVAPAPSAQVASAAASQGAGAPSNSSQPSGSIAMQVLGKNPAYVALRASYLDLGAVITGPTDAERNLGIHVFMDGKEVGQVQIDTSATTTYTVVYRVDSPAGAFGSVSRTIIVYDPSDAEAAAAALQSSAAPASPPAEEEHPAETPAPAPVTTPLQTESEPEPVAPAEEETQTPETATTTAPEPPTESATTTDTGIVAGTSTSTVEVPADTATSTDTSATSTTP